MGARGLIDGFSMSFEDLFCQQSAGGKILSEKMNEASVLAKDLPFLSTELLRELEELQVSRRFLHFRVSAHYRGSTLVKDALLASFVFARCHDGFARPRVVVRGRR